MGNKLAIEIKSTEMVNKKHIRGIKAFSKRFSIGRKIIVSFDTNKRRIGDMEIIPASEFLDELWAGKIW